MLVLSVTPQKAPDKETEITMTFEAGVPKTLNGKAMKVSEIITELNKIGGENGIGIIDIVENRVVGMKSRGVYETPGGTILMAAHEQLEELILDRETHETKKKLGSQFAQVVYEGKWFTPLREAIQAFVESTQKYVTGEVKFKLYKGNIIKAGTTSPYSLYNESLASFTTGDMYDHHDADGFITLFGLPLKVRKPHLKKTGSFFSIEQCLSSFFLIMKCFLGNLHFFLSNLAYTHSRNRVYNTETNGIKISIPTIPIRFPPSVTATNTQIAGSPTEFPTT